MESDPANYIRAARNLRLPIPTPAKPKAREAKSWRLLKLGQLLKNTQEIVIGGFRYTDTIWEITKVTDQGVTLQNAGEQCWNLTDPNWPGKFERVKAQRKTKTKTSKAVRREGR